MPRKVQGGRRSSKRGVNMRPGGSLYTNQEKSLYVKTLNASKDVNAGDNLNASENITTNELTASDKITTKSIDGNDTIVLNGTDGKIETNELTASVKITTKSIVHGTDTIVLNATDGKIETNELNDPVKITTEDLTVEGEAILPAYYYYGRGDLPDTSPFWDVENYESTDGSMRILLNFAVTTMKRGVDTEAGEGEGRASRQRRPIIQRAGIYMVSYGFSYTAATDGTDQNQKISVCLMKGGNNANARGNQDNRESAVHENDQNEDEDEDEYGVIIDQTTGGFGAGAENQTKGDHTNMVTFVPLLVNQKLSLGLTGLDSGKKIRIRSLYLGLHFIADLPVTA